MKRSYIERQTKMKTNGRVKKEEELLRATRMKTRGIDGRVRKALSILNQETLTVDLELLEQWCNGDKTSVPPELISKVLKHADPHKAYVFYLWIGRLCRNEMVKKLLDEGWHEKAIQLVDGSDQAVCKMRQHGHALDAESFKKLFHVVKRPELMIKCYKEMVAECITSADEEVCQSVLDVMVLTMRFEEACELAKEMAARGFIPRNLQVLFRGLLFRGKLEDAYNVFEMVDDEGAHNDLIVALDGEPDKTIELVKQMLGRGYKPSMRLLFDRLLAAGRDKDAHAALEMVGSEEAHCDFIRALIKVGHCEDAYQLVEELIGRHVVQHVQGCFNKLVHGLFETTSGDKIHAMKTIVRAFDLMHMAIATAGITPDTKSCIAIATALATALRKKEALHMFKFAKLDPLDSWLYKDAYKHLQNSLR